VTAVAAICRTASGGIGEAGTESLEDDSSVELVRADTGPSGSDSMPKRCGHERMGRVLWTPAAEVMHGTHDSEGEGALPVALYREGAWPRESGRFCLAVGPSGGRPVRGDASGQAYLRVGSGTATIGGSAGGREPRSGTGRVMRVRTCTLARRHGTGSVNESRGGSVYDGLHSLARTSRIAASTSSGLSPAASAESCGRPTEGCAA
jgi:hypothetical protein